MSRPIDVTVLAGDSRRKGLQCHNQSVRDYIVQHLDWLGTWNNETFWCTNRGADFAIGYLIANGFNVD